jgi:AbrB family looped-hinge helix DNA binding protein
MFPKMKLWGTATVGAKGQVVIPAEARTELDIKEGDKLIVMGRGPKGGLIFIKAEAVEQMMQNVQSDLAEIRKSTQIKGDQAE